jgi:hypothetical protein
VLRYMYIYIYIYIYIGKLVVERGNVKVKRERIGEMLYYAKENVLYHLIL